MINSIISNKQLVHVSLEIIILLGVVFHFNRKNRKIMSDMDILMQQLELQNNMIKKHEELIKKLLKRQPIPTHTNSILEKPAIQNEITTISFEDDLKKSSNPKNKDKYYDEDEESEDSEDEFTETEDEDSLNKELKEELNELTEIEKK